jgi:hypothetical protein
MFRLHSLRARVALYFAGLGALLSVVMAVMMFQSAHDLSVRLVDETLTAELEDYIARRGRNPQSLPPATVTLQGYVRKAGETDGVPDYLATLPPGRHEVRVGDLFYRAAVLDQDETRYYLLYDISLKLKREQRFAQQLSIVVVAMTLLSALLGIFLSGVAVAPVRDLAMRVRHRRPEDWSQPLVEHFHDREIGELAGVFDRQLSRMVEPYARLHGARTRLRRRHEPRTAHRARRHPQRHRSAAGRRHPKRQAESARATHRPRRPRHGRTRHRPAADGA